MKVLIHFGKAFRHTKFVSLNALYKLTLLDVCLEQPLVANNITRCVLNGNFIVGNVSTNRLYEYSLRENEIMFERPLGKFREESIIILYILLQAVCSARHNKPASFRTLSQFLLIDTRNGVDFNVGLFKNVLNFEFRTFSEWFTLLTVHHFALETHTALE